MDRGSPPTDRLRVSLVSLGCPKNLVDSERVLGAFVDRDLVICPHPEDAEVVVVNTCGFLAAAVEESVGKIREMVALKRPGGLRAVVVAGCLAGRKGIDIPALAPGIDAVVPLDRYDDLVKVCRETAGRSPGGEADYRRDLLTRGERIPLTPKGYAYLKISEGCNNPCAFCTIPSIKGRHVSRPEEEILAEAATLAANGTRELVVIGQDTTFYGRDTAGEFRLARLLGRIAEVPGIDWIRLMYAYPAYVTEELIDLLAAGGKLLPWLDMPVQHVSDPVLRRMKRPLGGPRTRALLGKLRERVGGIVLRTTLIVGAPGEGEAEFAELLDFVREFRFERLGVFTFSPEPDTPLGRADDQVPEKVRQERRAAIMERQQEIAFADARAQVGRTIPCLVETKHRRGVSDGRTWRDAPEIDGAIRIRKAPAHGVIGPVRVTAAKGYDLEGEWIG
ncbi:MAG: 30S ribosomal protein S12 methylthiotransferase RimO [Planctomycetes bacterium]|nr:30S ribosomal protein S12 methylthiotransferase RimO [Planctomycetota bacterium]